MNTHDLEEENRRLCEQNAYLHSALEDIRRKLMEQEDVIGAISQGEVDSVVVREAGKQEELYSLRRFTALRESEEQNRLMVDGVKDYAIYLVDPEGRVVNWNTGAARIYGYAGVEIVGQNISRFFTPEDTASGVPQRELAAAAASGHITEETWQVRKDGSPFRAEGTTTVLRNDAGRSTGFVKVVRDLTERIRSQETIFETSERLRIAVKAANIGLWDWDLETNRVKFSAEWKSQLGYAEHEIADEFDEWKSRLHPDDLSKTLGRVERFLANPTSMHQAEFRLRHRDGSYRWILAQGSLGRNPSGAHRHMIGSHIDITDRVASELALRIRDRAIQTIPQGILLTDPTQPDNPIVYASAGSERLTGYRSDELLGRNCRFLQGPKTDPDAVRMIREAIQAERGCSVEILNYRKDGTTFWNALFITPVRDDQGKLIQFIGVQVDVTERRNLEEQVRQSQRMEAIGQLAGGVAHDFNNLMTVVSGYSEILLMSMPEDDPQRSSILEISKAGERAAGLTRQLLAFSRKTMLEPQVLDLNALVRESETMLRRMIGEDVLLSTVLDPRIGRVKVDPVQIGQVLMNLAVNARDAMPTGGRLTIETRNFVLDDLYAELHVGVQPGRYVLLTVSDTGTGMTPEVKARIFEPFFTTKGVGKGTGLGLSVVHGIVKQSNGNIEVYSELGMGTTFKIYLPAATADDAASEVPETTISVRGSETVLLVEDEDSVREIAGLALRTQGYTVLSASNGKEAMRVADRYVDVIDAMVTDVVMPGMSGRQLAELLGPRLPRMKVLFVSGYTNDAVVRHGILQAEVAFLQKPYTPTTLLRKLRQVLDEKK